LTFPGLKSAEPYSNSSSKSLGGSASAGVAPCLADGAALGAAGTFGAFALETAGGASARAEAALAFAD